MSEKTLADAKEYFNDVVQLSLVAHRSWRDPIAAAAIALSSRQCGLTRGAGVIL